MLSTVRVRNAVVLVVIACLSVAALVLLRSADNRHYTAYFTEVKGIYVGDDVTVLGVPVGKITDIVPGPRQVKVEMEVEGDQKLPADVRAAIVSKSLVSVRAIVVGPVYGGGPVLKNGGVIPITRTTVPVEYDEVKDELVKLTDALGPNGANDRGAAGDLISSTAQYLDGRGGDINQTIKDLSAASQALSDNKGDLFATVRNLDVFVRALRDSDAQVRTFSTQLDTASGVLDKNSQDIQRAVKQFKQLTQETSTFFKDNSALLADTLTSLQTTTGVVAENRQNIADLLQIAPGAISNFYNIFDTRGPAITGELAVSNLGDPAYIICGGLFALGGSTTDCRTAIEPLVKYLKLSAPPLGLNPLTGPGVGPGGVQTPDEANILTSQGAASAASVPGAAGTPTTGPPPAADLLSQLASMLGGK